MKEGEKGGFAVAFFMLLVPMLTLTMKLMAAARVVRRDSVYLRTLPVRFILTFCACMQQRAC
jgi:hypothetical protein